MIQKSFYHNESYNYNNNRLLEIKPAGLVSRIRDVEAFWYKTELKIIHIVPLCLILLIVSDFIVF